MTEAPRRGPPPWLGPAVVLALLVGVLIWSAPTLLRVFHDPEGLQQQLQSFGAWSPVVYVALQALQVVVFVIPGEVVQIAGGWMFGFVVGSILSWLGAVLGAAVAFGLARRLGLRFVHAVAGPESVAKFDGLMGSPRFIGSMFLLFLIPGIPKDVLCYIAGLSRLKFVPFLLVSSLARLPGIFGSSLMGKAVFEQNWWLLGGIAAAAAALFALGWVFREAIFRAVERFAVAPPTPSQEDPHEPR